MEQAKNVCIPNKILVVWLIQSSSIILKEVVESSFRAEHVNKFVTELPQFPSYVFMLM
jgi:hypothetical protein